MWVKDIDIIEMKKVISLMLFIQTFTVLDDIYDHGRVLDEIASSGGSILLSVILGIIFVIVGGYF